MVEVVVWAVLGAVIGMIAFVSATRPHVRSWYVEAALGAVASSLAGAASSRVGAFAVRGVNAFQIDPLAYYATVCAGVVTCAALIVREAAAEPMRTLGSPRRLAFVSEAARFWLATRARPLQRFRGTVKESVRLSGANPAYAKGRVR